MSNLIAAADDKLDAARHHLRQMSAAQETGLQRHELAAFLGAARSVVMKLRDENAAQGAWVRKWEKRLSPDDQSLWYFMQGERNADVHEDGTSAHVTVDMQDLLIQMSFGLHTPGYFPRPAHLGGTPWIAEVPWFPQVPSSSIGKPALYFESEGVKRRALYVCKDYLRSVERFLADFKIAFP